MAKGGLQLALLILVVTAAFAFAAVPVFAHAADFNETKRLIDSNVACDELTDEQLEEIGEYYMEQMHPGDAHEFMHQRMGLVEGSETEEKFHIDLAKTMYCGELSTGMMGTGMGGMMGSAGSGMMGAGGAGMMGASYSYGLGNINNALLTLLLILLIIVSALAAVWLYKRIKRK